MHMHVCTSVFLFLLCESKNSFENSPKECAGKPENMPYCHRKDDTCQNALENLETGHIKDGPGTRLQCNSSKLIFVAICYSILDWSCFG